MKKPLGETPRRSFLKSAAGIGVGAAASSSLSGLAEPKVVPSPRSQGPASDRIGIATVGFGQQGLRNTQSALNNPGVQLIGIADLYSGRRERARELFGASIVTPVDYQELIQRGDVDVVIVATSDHWHTRICKEAMEAGKDVYCEKPMVQKLAEGRVLVDAQRETGQILQVGSQRTSSPTSRKAREIIASGAIGEVNAVEAWYHRSSANGAWEYAVPPDASPRTVDWTRFIGHAPRRSFDADRFFRWRSYWDYGTGIPGDLFVHLLTGIHFILDTDGPTRVYGSGGIRFWDDGREVPDVITGIFEYPASAGSTGFNAVLSVNFADHEDGSGLRIVGNEGVLEVGRQLKVYRKPRSYDIASSIRTFPEAMQRQMRTEHARSHPEEADYITESTEIHSAPPGMDGTTLHFQNLFDCVRSRTPAFQDASFGFRAAGPALAVNVSHLEKRAVVWDPKGMQVKQ